MSCEQCRGLMMDALYSEEMAPQVCYGFFQHLNDCPECHREYLELLETRQALSEWEIEEPSAATPVAGRAARWPRFRGLGWSRGWAVARDLAAALLILVGAATVLQGVGLWEGDRMTVSKRGLVEMMNDIYVANSAVDRRLFGQALVNFSDDINTQRQRDQFELADRIYFLEQQLLEVREENGRYLKALLSAQGE